jgi:prefoldin subunit 5
MSDDIQAKIDEAVAGLKRKNEELLGKIKDLKAKVPDVDVEKLKADAAELRKMREAADKEKGEYKKLYESLQKKYTKLETDLEHVRKSKVELRRDIALDKVLRQHKVIPETADILAAALAPKISEVEGEFVAEGKPLEDYVKDFVSSDVGKRFIEHGDSGGGATGGSGKSEHDYAKYFKKGDDYNLTKQAELAKSDPAAFKTLKERYSG